MIGKYRIYEVAKDLGLTSKEIISLVKDYTGVEKKHMTALSEDELNIIFEYYTQHNQVESFDNYFAQASEKTKTTKYEHMIPQLVSIEENPKIDGLLILLNTLASSPGETWINLRTIPHLPMRSRTTAFPISLREPMPISP